MARGDGVRPVTDYLFKVNKPVTTFSVLYSQWICILQFLEIPGRTRVGILSLFFFFKHRWELNLVCIFYRLRYGFLYHLICRSFQSPYPPRIFKKYTPIMHNSHRCLLFRRNFQIYLVLIFQVCINFLEKCDTTEWKWREAGCHQTEDTITGSAALGLAWDFLSGDFGPVKHTETIISTINNNFFFHSKHLKG